MWFEGIDYHKQINQVDVHNDGIEDGFIQNELKFKATNYLKKELNSDRSPESIQDLTDQLQITLERQDADENLLAQKYEKWRNYISQERNAQKDSLNMSIIENYFGTSDELTQLNNELGADFWLDISWLLKSYMQYMNNHLWNYDKTNIDKQDYDILLANIKTLILSNIRNISVNIDELEWISKNKWEINAQIVDSLSPVKESLFPSALFYLNFHKIENPTPYELHRYEMIADELVYGKISSWDWEMPLGLLGNDIAGSRPLETQKKEEQILSKVDESHTLSNLKDINLLNEKDQATESEAMLYYLALTAISCAPIVGAGLSMAIDIKDVFSSEDATISYLKTAWLVDQDYQFSKEWYDNVLAGIWVAWSLVWLQAIAKAKKFEEITSRMKNVNISWEAFNNMLNKLWQQIGISWNNLSQLFDWVGQKFVTPEGIEISEKNLSWGYGIDQVPKTRWENIENSDINQYSKEVQDQIRKVLERNPWLTEAEIRRISWLSDSQREVELKATFPDLTYVQINNIIFAHNKMWGTLFEHGWADTMAKARFLMRETWLDRETVQKIMDMWFAGKVDIKFDPSRTRLESSDRFNEVKTAFADLADDSDMYEGAIGKNEMEHISNALLSLLNNSDMTFVEVIKMLKVDSEVAKLSRKEILEFTDMYQDDAEELWELNRFLWRNISDVEYDKIWGSVNRTVETTNKTIATQTRLTDVEVAWLVGQLDSLKGRIAELKIGGFDIEAKDIDWLTDELSRYLQDGGQVDPIDLIKSIKNNNSFAQLNKQGMMELLSKINDDIWDPRMQELSSFLDTRVNDNYFQGTLWFDTPDLKVVDTVEDIVDSKFGKIDLVSIKNQLDNTGKMNLYTEDWKLVSLVKLPNGKYRDNNIWPKKCKPSEDFEEALQNIQDYHDGTSFVTV